MSINSPSDVQLTIQRFLRCGDDAAHRTLMEWLQESAWVSVCERVLQSMRAADQYDVPVSTFIAHSLVLHRQLSPDPLPPYNLACSIVADAVSSPSALLGDQWQLHSAWVKVMAAYVPLLRDAAPAALAHVVQMFEAAQPRLLLAFFEVLPDRVDDCTALGYGRNALKAVLRDDFVPVLLRLVATPLSSATAVTASLHTLTVWLGAGIASVAAVTSHAPALQSVLSAFAASAEPAVFAASAGVLTELIVQRDMVTTALNYARDNEHTRQFIDSIAQRVVDSRALFDQANAAGGEAVCASFVDVMLAIVERHTAFLWSELPSAAALAELMLHCTSTGSLDTADAMVHGWLTVADHAADDEQRAQVRPLLEFALKSCIQRCIIASDDDVGDDADAEARDEQMLSLRGRVAELLSVVADGICGVDAVMQVLVELKESSLEGCEAAWSMLPGVGTALYEASSAQVDALLAGADEAMRLGSGALRAAGANAVLGSTGWLRRDDLGHLPAPLLAAALSLIADGRTPRPVQERVSLAVATLCFNCAPALRESASAIIGAVASMGDLVSGPSRAMLARSCARLAASVCESADVAVALLQPLLSVCFARLRAAVRAGAGVVDELSVLVAAVNVEGARVPHEALTALMLLQEALTCRDDLQRGGCLRQADVCDGVAMMVRNAAVAARQSSELETAVPSLVPMLAAAFVELGSEGWLFAIAAVLSNADMDECDEDGALRCKLLCLLPQPAGGNSREVLAAYAALARAIVTSAAAAEFLAQRGGVAALDAALDGALALLDVDPHCTCDRDACEVIVAALGPTDVRWCLRAARTLLLTVLSRGSMATRSMCDLLYLCVSTSVPVDAQALVADVMVNDASAPVLQRLSDDVRKRCCVLIWALVANRQRPRFAALLKDIAALCAGAQQVDVLAAYEQ
jgi:hypothetical protein